MKKQLTILLASLPFLAFTCSDGDDSSDPCSGDGDVTINFTLGSNCTADSSNSTDDTTDEAGVGSDDAENNCENDVNQLQPIICGGQLISVEDNQIDVASDSNPEFFPRFRGVRQDETFYIEKGGEIYELRVIIP